MNELLKDYIEKIILPKYDFFDSAHGRDHVSMVIRESLRLAQFYEVDEDMVYTIAAYHDLGLCEGREKHHIVSGEILRADKQLKSWFSDEQINVMSEAVEDHRASSEHMPRTIYGMIVAEADRQIDGDVTLRRTVQYGLSKYPQLDREGQYNRALEHLQKKYAEGGYLKLYIPESSNAEKLAEFRKLINSPEDLRVAFDKIYDEETTK